MPAHKRIGQILLEKRFLDEEQLWSVLEESKRSESLLGQIAIQKGFVTEDQVAQALSEQLGMNVVQLGEMNIPNPVIEMVPETMAQVYKILPISFDKKSKELTVAMANPQNPAALDDLRNMLNVEVKGAISSEREVAQAIDRYYADKHESIEDVVAEISKDSDLLAAADRNNATIDLESIEELADAAPVRKLLNMVLLLAIKDRASDIHFEPFEDEFKMRYRVDGVLLELIPPPRHLATAISSRIKVMANLDIAERRLPQDGRIQLNVGGNPVDLRVSTLPTMYGESVVLRILDRTVVQLNLEKIGMPAHILTKWREIIKKPNGIVLVTGPTSSGKTTTLYATLNELNSVEDKIITTEEPVEYDIDGLVQCPINPEIDVTFANCLRAILRHDPDIVLVGETRDLETAEISIQASLTGHLVFTTLHTNDAPSSVMRLRDMGIPTFLITATVEGMLAQRLLRKICANCRTEFKPSPEILMELQLTPETARGKKFFVGRGCDKCNHSGYKGRTGIYELMVMNDEIRDLVMAGASTDQLTAAARRNGMITLREAGMQAIHDGITTIEEVVRATVVEEMDMAAVAV